MNRGYSSVPKEEQLEEFGESSSELTLNGPLNEISDEEEQLESPNAEEADDESVEEQEQIPNSPPPEFFAHSPIYTAHLCPPPPPAAEPRPPPAEELPPSYHSLFPDISHQPLLIDELPLGNYPILAVSAVLSTLFDLIGFVLVYLFASCHAQRTGARVGLSFTLLRYGAYLHSAVADEDTLEYMYTHHQMNRTVEEVHAQNQFLSRVLFVFGALLMSYSMVDYWRLQKLHRQLTGE
jgi:hypothetical protein